MHVRNHTRARARTHTHTLSLSLYFFMSLHSLSLSSSSSPFHSLPFFFLLSLSPDLFGKDGSFRVNVDELLERLRAVWDRMTEEWEERKRKLIEERTTRIRRVMEA